MVKKSGIELIHLKKHFLHGNKPLIVLDDICCTFVQSESYALMGISGSGKSTLLFLLLGFDEPTEGSILYDNHNLAFFSPQQRQEFLHKHIGFILQKPHLLKELTVLENIMLKGFTGTISDNHKQWALELLAAVGLQDKAHTPPATLSGGEQQRVALARALFNKPTFLIADEPTAHLDALNKKQVLNLMVNLCKEHTIGLIISTHDEEIARSMDHILLLRNGKLELMSPLTGNAPKPICQASVDSP